MGFEQRGYKIIDIIGIKGKKVDIVPTTSGFCLTELWNKKGEYLARLVFDNRKSWMRFVLVDLDPDMQMSKDCIDEAFELTEDYWKNSDELGELKSQVKGTKNGN